MWLKDSHYTTQLVDRIVFINHSYISEMGSHAELLRLRGQYYRLYTQQFKIEREQEYGIPKSELLMEMK